MKRLHPSTVIVAFLPEVVKAVKAVFPLLFVSFATGKSDYSELIAPLIGVLSGFGAISAYFTTRYGVENGHLVFRRGWLFKQDRSIPLDQIQNVNLRQGILEKLLKVVTLEVETAAGKGAEMKLQVITADAAEQLKTELLWDKAVEEAEPPPVISEQMSQRDLLLGGLTENRGIQVAFWLIPAFASAGALRFLMVDFALLKAFPSWVLVSFIVGLFLAVILGGWLFGIASYCLKYGGFSVQREEGRFTIRHGVFTKNQYVVRLKRIESVVVTATVWQRMIHRCNLSLGTAGAFGEQGTTAPIALMLPSQELAGRLRDVLLYLDLGALQWRRLPRPYPRVILTRCLMGYGALAAILWVLKMSDVPRLERFATIALVIVALLFVIVLFTSLSGLKGAGYAIGGSVVAFRYGYFNRTTTIMPVERIDTVSTTQSPLWRRGRWQSLVLKGMNQWIAIPMISEQDAEEIREQIRRRSGERLFPRDSGSIEPSPQPSSPSYPASASPVEHSAGDTAASIE